MDVLYIAFVDFEKKYYGPAKKILSAKKALQSNGHAVTLIGRFGWSTSIIDTEGREQIISPHTELHLGKANAVLFKKHQIDDTLKYLLENNKHYDLCYIRFDLSTVLFLHFLRQLKKYVDHIFIEIATYPYNKEYRGLINKIRLCYDQVCNYSLNKYVDRIVSFYDIEGKRFFRVPVIQVPNGFDFDSFQLLKSTEVPNDIEIIAVSTMRIWHGYERFIEGLKNYYDSGNKRKIVLHLVGNGPEEQKYCLSHRRS